MADSSLASRASGAPPVSLTTAQQDRFDFVVVGGGSAGCVLANRLSADPKVTVCLLEAGPDDDVNPKIQQADMWFSILGDPKMHWKDFHTVEQHGLHGRKVDLCQARVLGGCGSHNASFYVRGSRFDYNKWAHSLGCTGWSWDEVLPFFNSIETWEEASDFTTTRGKEGELKVRRPTDLTNFAKSIIRICEEKCSLPRCPDYNDGQQQEGVSPVQFNVQKNQRQSAYHQFIKPIIKTRSNLTVLSSSQVSKIIFEGKRAVGVNLLGADGEGEGKKVLANRDIILAAGAYNTPKLLLLSGLGPAAHLQEHNIPVVHEVPGVGLNLSDHLWLLFREFVGGESWESNPWTEDWSQIQGFGCLDGSIGKHQTDYQFLFMSRDTVLEGFPFPEELLRQPTKLWGMAIVSLHPTSRGTVRLRSSSPSDAPLIDPRYISNEEDINIWRGIIGKMRVLADEVAKAHSGSAPVIPPPGGDDLEFVLNTATTMWHPVGTAKMGNLASDPLAVVDPLTMKVRGVEGLRVADASVIPELTSGNTNTPTMAVAARAAFLIAEQERQIDHYFSAFTS